MPDSPSGSNVVDSLHEAAPLLRRPFSPEAMKFRPVGGGFVVPYVDARTVIERLNAVVPHGWSTNFETYPGSKDVVCFLTIFGVTRSDVGSPSKIDPVKGAHSDALKRAAVHFGVGVSIYAIRRIRMSEISDESKTADGKGLTDAGQDNLRKSYAKWLAERGGKDQFGEPLDHGDEEGAVGSEVATGGETPDAPVQPSEEELALVDSITATYESLTTAQRKGFGKAKFDANLKAAKAEGESALKEFQAEVEGRAK